MYICFITDLLPSRVCYCGKQNPQTFTKLCDFQKTETKYVSGEEKRRSVLIWFTAEAAERETWKTQVYKSEARLPPAHTKLSFSLWKLDAEQELGKQPLGKDGHLLENNLVEEYVWFFFYRLIYVHQTLIKI